MILAPHVRLRAGLVHLAVAAGLVQVAPVMATAAVRKGPELEIEASAELDSSAARLGTGDLDLGPFARLIGVSDFGPPVRVVLLAESSDLARQVPPWVAGFANAESDLVVLFPERVPTYPHSSFPELVRHELSHVLIDRASGGAALPRWFHEGLAMVGEGGWQAADRSRLALAVVGGGQPRLEQLDMLFGAGERWVGRAYATSGAFVRRLMRRHGASFVSRLLAETRRGAGFEEAFSTVTGETPDIAFQAFWQSATLWYRWVPFVTSTTVLWIVVTVLALVAIRRRRQRDREQLAAWEVEEAAWSETDRDRLVN